MYALHNGVLRRVFRILTLKIEHNYARILYKVEGSRGGV